MSNWKAILGLIVLVAVLWWLYPSRQLAGPPEANVVEIFYMGPGGGTAGTRGMGINDGGTGRYEADAFEGMNAILALDPNREYHPLMTMADMQSDQTVDIQLDRRQAETINLHGQFQSTEDLSNAKVSVIRSAAS